MRLPVGRDTLLSRGAMGSQTGAHHAHPSVIRTVAPLPNRVIREVAQHGLLESWGLAYFLLGVAGLLFAGWTVAALRAHRRNTKLPGRSWVRRAGLASVGSLTVVLALAIGVNAYVGYIPTLGSLFGNVTGPDSASGHLILADPLHAGPAATESLSEVVRIGIGAPTLDVPARTAFVYLPPGYFDRANASRRYPVVYLIHGFPGTAMDWFRAGQAQRAMDVLIAARLIQPMIVVSPDVQGPSFTSDTECLNIPHGMQLESYVAYSVVHAIDTHFRTIANRAGRAIGGMSSGAYCALNIGLHHLHRFSVILGSAPYGDPGPGPLYHFLAGSDALWRANAPDVYLPRWQFPEPVAVLLDAGSADPITRANAYQLSHQLAADGQIVAVRIAPNLGHTWWVARLELPYSLVFASHYLGRLPAGGSDAADAAEFARILAWARTLPPLAWTTQPLPPRPSAVRPRKEPPPPAKAVRRTRAAPAASPSRSPTHSPQPTLARTSPNPSPTPRPSPKRSPAPSPSPSR